MSDRLKKLVGLIFTTGGIYALSRYMKKCAEKEPGEDENTGANKAREAAKRTYIAIKEIKDDAVTFVGNIVKTDEADEKE